MTTSSNNSPVYWPVLLFIGFYNLIFFLEGDLAVALIRTLIQCGETGTETEFCAQYPDSCVSRPPQDASWSGSSYCFDKNYVLLETAEWSARMTAFAMATSFLSTPILGALSDTYGRKNILLLGLLGIVMNLSANCIAYKMPLSQAFSWLNLGALTFAFLASGVRAASMAMAADTSENTVEQRGPAMAALQMVQVVSNLVAYAIGFMILLQNLTSYLWVYVFFALASAGFGIFSCFLLKETLPPAVVHEQVEESLPPAARHKQMRASKGLWENFESGLRVLYADKLLLGFLPVVFLAAVAYSGIQSMLTVFLIAQFQYSQAVASLNGIFIQPFIFGGTLFSSYLMKWVGPEKAYFTGILLSASAYSIQGVCMCFHNIFVSQVTWWFGFCILGVYLGIHDVAAGTVISMRVKEEHQSKILGITWQFAALGSVVGSYVWGDMIFDPAAQGLAAGACFLWSSSAAFAAGILCMALMRATDAREGERKTLQSSGSSYGSH